MLAETTAGTNAGSPSDDPPPSTPKKTPKQSRRIQPKIVGHTSPTPRAAGTAARNSLRTLAPTSARPAVRPPVGAPGMRGFPRARHHAADPHAGVAVSVAKALREQAAAAPKPTLLDDTSTPKPRRSRKPGPARPSVRGRPTTPDEQPLTHAPAAERSESLRASLGTSPGTSPGAGTSAGPGAPRAQADSVALAAHRPARRRTELWARDASRPRPSRVLAELNAALADEAAAAE